VAISVERDETGPLGFMLNGDLFYCNTNKTLIMLIVIKLVLQSRCPVPPFRAGGYFGQERRNWPIGVHA